jgi:hypothetical protein
MSFKRVNEKSRLPIEISFYDGDHVPATPSTVRYRVDCIDNQTELLGWSEGAPGTELNIVITPTQNRIINSRNRNETKELTVECNYGTDDQFVGKVRWVVRNLYGVS